MTALPVPTEQELAAPRKRLAVALAGILPADSLLAAQEEMKPGPRPLASDSGGLDLGDAGSSGLEPSTGSVNST